MPAPIDYQDLLKRYIQHVCNEEGTDFIYRCITKDEAPKRRPELTIFTQEEIDELERLAE